MTTKQPSPRIAFTSSIECITCKCVYLAKWVIKADTPIIELPTIRYSNCDGCGQCHAHKIDLHIQASYAVESIQV